MSLLKFPGITLLLLACLFINNNAQDTTSSYFELFPSGLNISSFKANYQEARIGVLYFPSNRNLKVDVGNSIDIIGMHIPSKEIFLTVGIDFFAYALSTSFEGQRLQIDALDGLFGGNLSFKKKIYEDNIFLRLRVLHNSAHLVDGHYNINTGDWIDGKKPIPFTKDFGELFAGYQLNSHYYSSRIYIGTSYATLVRPSFIKRWNFSGGIETASLNLFNVLNKPANVFLSYHFLLNGANEYTGNSSVMAGLKFGKYYQKGFLLYIEYYSGSRRFSEYYDQRVKEFGIGFSVDFF